MGARAAARAGAALPADGSDLNEARSVHRQPASCSARLNDLAGRGYRVVYRRSLGAALRGRGLRRLLRRGASRAPSARSGRPCSWRRPPSCSAPRSASAPCSPTAATRERLIPAEFFTESPRERVERIESSDERIAVAGARPRSSAPSSSRTTSRCPSWPSRLGALTLVGRALDPLLQRRASSARWPGCTGSTASSASSSRPGWDRTGPSSCRRSCSAARRRPAPRAGAAGCRASCRSGAALRAGAALGRAHARRTTALVLVVAGLVEGSFSQFTARTIPVRAQDRASPALLFALLVAWLFARRGGRRPVTRRPDDPDAGARRDPARAGRPRPALRRPARRLALVASALAGRRVAPAAAVAAAGAGRWCGALRCRELRDRLGLARVLRGVPPGAVRPASGSSACAWWTAAACRSRSSSPSCATWCAPSTSRPSATASARSPAQFDREPPPPRRPRRRHARHPRGRGRAGRRRARPPLAGVEQPAHAARPAPRAPARGRRGGGAPAGARACRRARARRTARATTSWRTWRGTTGQKLELEDLRVPARARARARGASSYWDRRPGPPRGRPPA